MVSIKSTGKATGLLIAQIYVLPEGISIQINGGNWETFGQSGAHLSGTIKQLDAHAGTATIAVHCQGAKAGIFNWTRETVTFDLRRNSTDFYSHLYGDAALVSGGALTVDGAAQSATGYVVEYFGSSRKPRFQLIHSHTINNTSLLFYECGLLPQTGADQSS